jgi:hypothetical protein
MAYFIFQKNFNNIDGSIYKVAETANDLNNINFNKNDYKIIEDNSINFDNIKLNLTIIQKYNNESIIFLENIFPGFYNVQFLKNYVNDLKEKIKEFTDNNLNHSNFNQWNNYYNQLNNLNENNFTFPNNITLEQYFKNNNLPYFSILQLP